MDIIHTVGIYGVLSSSRVMTLPIKGNAYRLRLFYDGVYTLDHYGYASPCVRSLCQFCTVQSVGLNRRHADGVCQQATLPAMISPRDK
jgi:hypothetical protein